MFEFHVTLHHASGAIGKTRRFKRARNAKFMFLCVVYDAVRSNAWLDTVAGHRVMRCAKRFQYDFNGRDADIQVGLFKCSYRVVAV